MRRVRKRFLTILADAVLMMIVFCAVVVAMWFGALAVMAKPT